LQPDKEVALYRPSPPAPEEGVLRTVAQKMGLKEGMRSYFLHAPRSALDDIDAPALNIGRVLRGTFEYIHLFATLQAEMEASFPKLAGHLEQTGMLWVSWPKAKQLGTDLSLPHVIRIGYSYGLVESTTLSVNATWSGMKFTHPKRGKAYHNSYGRLPDGTT
jgi:hypothetical protein